MSSFNKKGLRNNKLKERKIVANQLKYFSMQLNVFSDSINECVNALEEIEGPKTKEMITKTVKLISVKNDLSDNLVNPMINKLLINYNLLEEINEPGNNT